MRILLLSLLATFPAVAGDLAEQSQAAGARLHQTEERMAAAWGEYDALIAQRDIAQRAADRTLMSVAAITPALIRLQRLPPAAILAGPAPPAEALRGYAILRAWTRQASAQAGAFATARDDAASRAGAVAATLPRLVELARLQQSESAALDQALLLLRTERQAQRDVADRQTAAAARQAAEEAARAPSVRAAIGALARPSTTAPGRGVLPVAGQVIRRWGDPTDAGPATGITFRPPPGARVVAPCGGRVVFAAPFRSYGLLVIIDCGGGLHAVLAGFDRLDAAAGLVVPAGEVVGTMAAAEPSVGAGRGTLYVELRRGGQPVDPAPFLGSKL